VLPTLTRRVLRHAEELEAIDEGLSGEAASEEEAEAAFAAFRRT
jgi:hypothetical protein